MATMILYVIGEEEKPGPTIWNGLIKKNFNSCLTLIGKSRKMKCRSVNIKVPTILHF